MVKLAGHDLTHDICVTCLNSVILSKGNDKWLVLSSEAFKVDCSDKYV